MHRRLPALELGQQVAARRWRQLLQIIVNPVGMHHGERFPQSDCVGARPSHAGIAAGTRGQAIKKSRSS
jgi:hypothetical protein